MPMKCGDYALVALDMDGTLLNSDHQTTPYTRNVIRKAADSGKIAAISTGRCLSELREHIQTISGISYVICENGACVYDVYADAKIRQISIPQEEIEYVISLALNYDVTRQFFMDNQSYIQCDDEEGLKRYHVYDYASVFRAGSVYVEDMFEHYFQHRGSVEKINLYFASEQDREAFCVQMAGRDVLLAHSIGIGIEVSPSDATKARGLETLCNHLDLPLAASMAIGDAGNDVDIMKVAGLSVAMGNAIAEIAEIADVMTDDCDNDGAAKAIEKYMMNASARDL